MQLDCPSIVANINAAACVPVDHYCERTSAALDAEPVNALTNAAFLLGAWAAWHLLNRVPEATPRAALRLLILFMASVGLGSFLFHTVGTRWAELGDVAPIGLFLVVYMWIFLSHFFTLNFIEKVLVLALVFGAAAYGELEVPGDVLAGGALYVPILTALIVLGLLLVRRAPIAGFAMIAATSVWMISLIVRMLDNPVCAAFPLGTHFLWHLTNAIVLYLLTSIVILYKREHPELAAI